MAIGITAGVASLLQGCAGADAVAPRSSTPTAPTSPSTPAVAPRPALLAPASDTLVVGDTVALSGSALDAGTVLVTLAGVPLPVLSHGVSAAGLATARVVLPRSLGACGTVPTLALRVRAGDVDSVWQRPVRTARRLTLAVGQHTALADSGAACIELAAADGADASMLLTLSNATEQSTTQAAVAVRATARDVTSAQAVPSAPAHPVAAPAASVRHAAGVSGDAHATHLDADRAHFAAVAASWQALTARGAMRAARAMAPAQLGDTLTLRALYASCNAGQAVRARVVYAGRRALVLEDVSAPRAGSMDAEYRALGAEYDEVVHPLLLDAIGDPNAMDARLGGDGRVTMLFTRFVNDSLAGTAGYVSACNFQPASLFPASNARPLLYGRVPSAVESPAEWRRVMRSTVVHEAKHLASYAERLSAGHAFEATWLEEATARVAEELYARRLAQMAWKGRTGYAASVLCELQQCDGRPLVAWKLFSVLHQYLAGADTLSLLGPSGRSDQTWYASGWSLVRWVVDEHAANESAWLRALVRGGAQVGASQLAALSGRSADALLAGWANATAATALGIVGAGTQPATWDVADVWRGLSDTFAGTYRATPLQPLALQDGVEVRDLAVRPLGVRYVTLATGRGRVLSLDAGAAVRVGVTRVR
ncbi:MAG: hypothetical protein LCH84_05615 [Gemmatimonadetes bacterium]|nr:hypothetical protein [Gemmatimonadota bacterium]